MGATGLGPLPISATHCPSDPGGLFGCLDLSFPSLGLGVGPAGPLRSHPAHAPRLMPEKRGLWTGLTWGGGGPRREAPPAAPQLRGLGKFLSPPSFGELLRKWGSYYPAAGLSARIKDCNILKPVIWYPWHRLRAQRSLAGVTPFALGWYLGSSGPGRILDGITGVCSSAGLGERFLPRARQIF